MLPWRRHSNSSRVSDSEGTNGVSGEADDSEAKGGPLRRLSLRNPIKSVKFREPDHQSMVNSVSSSSDSSAGAQIKGTFIDVDQMKEKVRESLFNPAKKPRDFYKKSGPSQALARSVVFENVTLMIIAFNAIWIAHDTDANHSDVLLDADVKFQIAENVFCFYFSIELVIRFLAFEYKCNIFRDAWFVFDSALVCMMVLETWVLTFLILISGSSSGSAGGDVSVIRVARLLRLSRMARMARLLRVVPELMILIKGMLAAIRSVCFTIILLMAIVYVFSICLTQLAQDTELGEKYFTSVPATMYRLMMQGVLLDGPKELSDKLAQESWYFPPIFWFFVLLAAMTVLNMLVGVLCEVVSGVAAVEKEENLLNFVKGRVRKIVEEIDEDGNMSISKGEFCQILENRSACRALQDVGVDVIGLVDFADTIFEDEKGQEKAELSFVDFMDLVLQLRGSNVATVKDIVQLRKMMGHITSKLNDITKHIHRKKKDDSQKSPGEIGDKDLLESSSGLTLMTMTVESLSGALQSTGGRGRAIDDLPLGSPVAGERRGTLLPSVAHAMDAGCCPVDLPQQPDSSPPQSAITSLSTACNNNDEKESSSRNNNSNINNHNGNNSSSSNDKELKESRSQRQREESQSRASALREVLAPTAAVAPDGVLAPNVRLPEPPHGPCQPLPLTDNTIDDLRKWGHSLQSSGRMMEVAKSEELAALEATDLRWLASTSEPKVGREYSTGFADRLEILSKSVIEPKVSSHRSQKDKDKVPERLVGDLKKSFGALQKIASLLETQMEEMQQVLGCGHERHAVALHSNDYDDRHRYADRSSSPHHRGHHHSDRQRREWETDLQEEGVRHRERGQRDRDRDRGEKRATCGLGSSISNAVSRCRSEGRVAAGSRPRHLDEDSRTDDGSPCGEGEV